MKKEREKEKEKHVCEYTKCEQGKKMVQPRMIDTPKIFFFGRYEYRLKSANLHIAQTDEKHEYTEPGPVNNQLG